MAIFEGSRYKNLGYIGIRQTDGSTKRFLDARRPLTIDDVRGEFVIHPVQGGEVLDLLAYRYYGDESKWWIIAEVNDIFFMYDIVPGQQLVIPNKKILEKLEII
jgi:hypothetical protein